jgi:VanZ family protein
MTSGKPKLAGIVALAYTLVIVYASLQPFAGWRMPPEEVLGFLGAPWPRYVTLGDVLLNVVAYLPLGAMLFLALRRRLNAAAAAFSATLMAGTLSLGLESAQMFLPTRIASNLDLLANSAGAGIGALGAWMLALPVFASKSFAALRQRLLRADVPGDAALIVVALWIVIQFQQAPLAFSSGDLRDTLRIAPLFAHAPQTYLLAEACIAALAMLVIGLLISLLLQPGQPVSPMVAAALLLAFGAKSIATAMLARAAHWLQWLTPGVVSGIAAGLALLWLLLRLSPALRAASAIGCVILSVVIVNLTPENPYQAPPVFMLSQQATHLVNFNHIVRAVARLWPLLAVAALLALAQRSPRREIP